jgi:hypothetical protein
MYSQKRNLLVVIGLLLMVMLVVPFVAADDDEPEVLTIETFMSLDGGENWVDAAAFADFELEEDQEVLLKFVVTNMSEYPAMNLSLSNSQFDFEDCEPIAELLPGETFECLFGPMEWDDSDHLGVTTAMASVDDEVVIVEEGEEYDFDVIIVIEGEVIAIEGNIITIFEGFDLVMDEDDPLITFIFVGDELRIVAAVISGDEEFILLVLHIDFLSVEVYILDGVVWRDADNCQNPPPPWAPANGWRRRCEGGGDSSGSGSNS